MPPRHLRIYCVDGRRLRRAPAGGTTGPSRGWRVMPQTHAVTPETGKEPLDIDAVFERLRRAVTDLPKAAMFDLRDRGYGSPFEQLVGSLISARTRDETTVEVCLRLFAEARTPQDFADLPEDRLVALLNGATFPEPKARDLKVIARQI